MCAAWLRLQISNSCSAKRKTMMKHDHIEKQRQNWRPKERLLLIFIFLLWAGLDDGIGYAAESLMSQQEFLEYDLQREIDERGTHQSYASILSLVAMCSAIFFIGVYPQIAIYPLMLLSHCLLARIPESSVLNGFASLYAQYGIWELVSFQTVVFIYLPVGAYLTTMIFGLKQFQLHIPKRSRDIPLDG